MNPATHPSAIKAEGKRHELFQFIADCVSSGLQSSGVKPDEAVLLGGSVANQLADTFGGQTIAFPRDMALKATQTAPLVASQTAPPWQW